MTEKQLREKHDILEFFYHHKESNFVNDGFTFKKDEYYTLYQDEGGISLIDDNGKWHDVTEEAQSGMLSKG